MALQNKPCRPAAPEISTVRSPNISAFSMGHMDNFAGGEGAGQQQLLHGGGEQRGGCGGIHGKRMGWAAVTSLTKPMASL